jgi:hypothetical protein
MPRRLAVSRTGGQLFGRMYVSVRFAHVGVAGVSETLEL